MALLTIDGVGIPDPSSLVVDSMDLSSEESGRLLNGTMEIDYVTTKRTVAVKYPAVPWSVASTILKSVKVTPIKTTFSVRYPDPEEGTYVTKTMYVGDKSSTAVTLVSGKEYWDGISFTLIEI